MPHEQTPFHSVEVPRPLAAMLFRFELAALAIWFLLRWIAFGLNLPVPIDLPFPDAVTIIIATLATLFALGRWWPAQNLVAVTVLILVLSGVFEYVLVEITKVPF